MTASGPPPTADDGAASGGDRGHRPWDPGLQPERTSLSWRRTVLALAILFVATTRLVLSVPLAAAVVATVGVLACLALGGLIHRADQRRDERLRAEAAITHVAEPALTTALVVVLAVVAAWGIIAD